jgi:hypothetical protein
VLLYPKGAQQRDNREVARFHDGACLDFPDRGDGYLGARCELFLGQACLLA